MFINLYDEVTHVLCVSPFVTRQISVRPWGASECLTDAFQPFLAVVSQNFYLHINNQFLAISCSSRR